MLKRSHRLPAKIRLSGSLHLTNPLFTIRYAKGGLEENRFAIIVSKRVSNKAVIRNRARRQISEGIKNLLTEIRPSYDFLFNIKKEILDKSTVEVYREIQITFKKAGLIK
jgi:ribonuclease P protein component